MFTSQSPIGPGFAAASTAKGCIGSTFDASTEIHGVRLRATEPAAAGRLWWLNEQLTGARID